MLGFPNQIDAAVLTGGAFVATMPLTKVQGREIKDIARTVNAQRASTFIKIDQLKSSPARVLAIINHNFSLDARFRVRGTNTADKGDDDTYEFDSGWQDVWPTVYPYGTKEWEDPSWWGGKYSEEEIAGYTPSLIYLLPSIKLMRYWRIDIDDTTNKVGYLQFGRMFIGPTWQPTINMSYGASLALETDTEVQKAQGGAEYFDVKTPFRVKNLRLDNLTTDEAMANVFELQRRAGIDKEILWVFDPDDQVHAIRNRYLGRLRQLSPIEFPYFRTNSAAFEIKEIQ